MDSFVKQNSPWISEDLSKWDKLIEGQRFVKFRKGSTLFRQAETSDFVYIVKSGRVRITSYHDTGGERQLYIAETGCLIGENAVFLEQEQLYTAITIVDSVLYQISVEHFLKILSGDFDLSKQVMQSLCRKNNVLYFQVLEVSFAQSMQRIAQVLLNLMYQYGETCDEGSRISIRFTHQDVANITSVSRVTVSNSLNELALSGVLKRQNGFIIICQEERLKDLALGI